jgi:hypothetical protein
LVSTAQAGLKEVLPSNKQLTPGIGPEKPLAINAKTAKSVYSFTHFDAWAYGTNFFTISLFKSGRKPTG